jgi:hypothetical protein
MQQHFLNYYNQVSKYQKYFDQELNKKQREIKNLMKHRNQFNTLYEQLAPTYTKIFANIDDEINESDNESNNEFVDEQENKEPSQVVPIEQVVKEYIKQALGHEPPTIKTLSKAFNLPDKIIETMGLQTIIDHAKNIYLQNTINQPTIKAIVDFCNEHQRQPTRKELTSSKIIKEHMFKQITKVLRVKNPSNAIAEYCMTINRTN